MAQKKITDLQLRSSFDATCNIPVDDASQTWRTTGQQVLDFTRGVIEPVLGAKTANYTILTTDRVLTMDATAGVKTFTLPTAVGISGRIFFLKKIDSSVNAVTIATTSSQTIDGAATASLTVQNESIELVSNGTNWLIVNRAGTSGISVIAQGPTSAITGSATDITGWSELSDPFNAFNPTTGIFTAPRNSLYLFSIQLTILMTGSTVNQTLIVGLIGGTFAGVNGYTRCAAGLTAVACSFSYPARMLTGETAKFQGSCPATGSSILGAPYSFMSITEIK